MYRYKDKEYKNERITKNFFTNYIGCAITLASCESQIPKVAHEYCTEHGKTAKDYHSIMELRGEPAKVSKLDSIAYSDIFRGTKLAKDSAKVAEFNKFASENRCKSALREEVNEYQNSKARNNGMLLTEFDEMKSYLHLAHRQNFLDNYMYKKFFKENGVLDKNVEKQCDEYSNHILYNI